MKTTKPTGSSASDICNRKVSSTTKVRTSVDRSRHFGTLPELHKAITTCEDCPRLRSYCTDVAQKKRRSYMNENYWGKPIPGFGDTRAQIMIVGLAPAAHGANRTGRIFTGDRSGDWLYRALYKQKLANQPISLHSADQLTLYNTYVSCVVRCAPPDNKPSPAEQLQCLQYLKSELLLMPQVKVFVALGQIAYQGIWPLIKPTPPDEPTAKPKFGHNKIISLGSKRTLILSYHPSQQNTFTGRLTESMFDSVFKNAISFLSIE